MAATHIHSSTSRSIKRRVRHFAKLSILLSLKSIGVFALARAWHRKRPRILCYHGAWLAEDGFRGDAMFINGQTFERRLDFLAKRRFNVISLDRAVDGLAGRSSLPEDAVVITIDDGWYSTYAKMLPALKQRCMPATIYCDTGNLLAGGAVPNVAARYLHAIYRAPKGRKREVEDACERATYPGLDRNAKQRGFRELVRLLRVDFAPYEKARVFDYMTTEELREASQAGFNIELHSHTHNLHGFEPRLVEQEIETNRAVLSNIVGRPAESFRHFCYPSGVYAASVRPVLQRLGILSATVLDSRLVGAGDDPLFLPRILDGEHLSPLEFEAVMCGVPDLMRAAIGALRRQIAAFTSLWAAKDVYRPTTAR